MQQAPVLFVCSIAYRTQDLIIIKNGTVLYVLKISASTVLYHTLHSMRYCTYILLYTVQYNRECSTWRAVLYVDYVLKLNLTFRRKQFWVWKFHQQAVTAMQYSTVLYCIYCACAVHDVHPNRFKEFTNIMLYSGSCYIMSLFTLFSPVHFESIRSFCIGYVKNFDVRQSWLRQKIWRNQCKMNVLYSRRMLVWHWDMMVLVGGRILHTAIQ